MAMSKYSELVAVRPTVGHARDVCAVLRENGIPCKEWHGLNAETTGYQVLVMPGCFQEALALYETIHVDNGGPEHLPDRY